MDAAEKIRSKMTIELVIDNNDLSSHNKDKSKIDFISYFREQTDIRYEVPITMETGMSVHKYLENSVLMEFPINKIDPK